ncbi:MAG: hypothetical protein EA351_12940 [Gemmatimonadales bacterium]|nr:MAG: hypothetical protein EA351_12940 [Gemmatimonadales bacterium]
MGLLLRTTPFLVFNAAVYGAFFLAAVAWLGVFGGLAVLFAPRIELLSLIFMVIAVAGPFGVLTFGRRYILYLVKGGHIAVITKLLVDGEIPEGRGQIAYGRDEVQKRFRDVSILFVLDRMIDRVVRRFTNRFVRLVDWLPLGQGAGKAARWVAAIVNRSLSYVDQAILSYAISLDDDNVWRSSRHGLILYAQAYKPVLMTALKVWLLGRAFFIVSLVVIGVPGVLFLLVFDAIWLQIAVLAATLILASLLVRAVYEPFATTWTIVTYHRAIQGVEVDPVWDERLQSVSGEFKKLVGRAREFDPRRDPVDEAGAAAGGGMAGGQSR